MMSLQVGEGVRNGWPMPVRKNRLSGGGGQGFGGSIGFRGTETVGEAR